MAPNCPALLSFCYRATLRRARLWDCMTSSCLSVCDVEVCFFHTGCNTSKIISRPTSLRSLLTLSWTWAIWCNGNTPKLGLNRGGGQEHIKPVRSPKWCKIGPWLLLRSRLIGSHIRAFDWHQCQWPWMTLNGQNAPSPKWNRLTELTRKIRMKTDKLFAAKCSPVSLLSCNIRFVWIFAGRTGQEAPSDRTPYNLRIG